jgi:hypothetical protein
MQLLMHARASGRRARLFVWRNIMKSLLAVLLAVSIYVHVFAQNKYDDNADDLDKPIVNNAALFIRPIDIYNEFMNGYYGICIESQSAFKSFWGLRANIDFLFNGTTYIENLTIGPQINLSNNILEGVLVGVYPGIQYWMENERYGFSPRLIAECTYNYKMQNNWGYGLYISTDLFDSEYTRFGFKIGKYLANSYYKN